MVKINSAVFNAAAEQQIANLCTLAGAAETALLAKGVPRERIRYVLRNYDSPHGRLYSDWASFVVACGVLRGVRCLRVGADGCGFLTATAVDAADRRGIWMLLQDSWEEDYPSWIAFLQGASPALPPRGFPTAALLGH